MEGSAVLRRENCRAKGGSAGFKVAILGAAGGIGQPLSMLMKMNPLVSVLHLYDVVNTPGVTADISHMDTGPVVNFHTSRFLVLIFECIFFYFLPSLLEFYLRFFLILDMCSCHPQFVNSSKYIEPQIFFYIK
jgi:hypothetical protein